MDDGERAMPEKKKITEMERHKGWIENL